MVQNGPENEPADATDADGNELLLIGLATGKSIVEAAALAGMSRTTANRRLRSKAFRERLADLRRSMLDRAVGQFADGAAEAAKRLRELIAHESPAIALSASRAFIELGSKMREGVEIQEQLRQHGEQLAALQAATKKHEAPTR